MTNTPMPKSEINDLSRLSGRWENILIEQLQPAPGEGTCHFNDEHTIFMSLAPRPVPMLHIQGGKTYTGMYGQGDICITPAKTPLFARWDIEDNYLRIRLKTQFIETVASETMETNGDRLELIPQFRMRHPQIEAIAMMLFTELQRSPSGSRLYLDSLTNALAVNLLRQFSVAKPQLPIYEGGLPQSQLMQILDYIDTHIDQDIKLSDLARLLDMSQFHFSRLFKQSIGMSPYQYLIQQRVERAKRLLKQTDQFISDIALDCGFNSHSHLSKQFRQLTGMTPRAYRAN